MKSGRCSIVWRRRVIIIQDVGDGAASAGFLCDLETCPDALGKACQFVIGETEDFAQDARDFVVRVGIHHDGEQRGQPGVGWVLRLEIRFRLHLGGKTDIQQGSSQ